MYRMLYNDSFLFDPFDETRIVSSASITTNVNAASYLDFTIAATHPLYDTIEQRSGIITLYSDNEKLFQGQITSIDMDMDGNKSVTCSSALDWLKDVQLRPYSTDQDECNEYEFKLDKAPDALDAYFQWLIDQYNAQNKDNRYFTINVNQAADLTSRNIVYFASTSPRSVADAIEEDILKTFGGYLVLRYDDDQLILDLYSDIHEMNEQVIDYGENILDISRNESTDDQYTAVYPIGKTPQYTAEQQKYHDEKDAYDEHMKQREATEKAAIDKLKKEEDAEQNRINGITDKNAKKAAQDALRRRKDQRQAREKAFSDETKRLQDAQKIKDDKNAADKTKPNPITIESLDNGGYEGDLDIFKDGDVIYSVSYVARYGYKEFVYSETDVDDKKELLKLAVAKLKSLMAPVLTIDVRAVDQALYNQKHRHLFAGQAVRVRSKAHNVDEFMMVSSIDLDLIDPSQTTATLGVAYDTLTGQQSSFLRNLNSKIVASVDAVDKLGEDVKTTEITLGKVETVVENTNNKTDLIINTVDDYKWMTDTAWGKADDAQADADKANQGVTDTNIRIDNIKMATDERIDEMETDISGINTEIDNTKAEVEQAKQTAEQIRQDAQAGIEEAKQQAEAVRTEANTAINTVKTDLAATEAKAQQAASNASAALGGLSSANTDITNLRTEVDRHTENITNINGEIVGVKDTISGVSETANSALTVATTNTHSIAEHSNRIDTAYSDIEATRTSVSEVKQTADGLKVNLETNYLDKNAIGANYASKAELSATSESITSTVSKTYATKAALEGLQNIADAAIETWSGQTVPTASNPPASTWTTDALKRQHSGDIYYDMSTGKSYRWGSADGTAYSWSMIADSDITKAIADAAKAQQTADGAKQDVVNLSNDVKATYTSKSEFKQTSDEIKASVSEVASVNETNAQKIAEVSVKADGISAKVAEQAETLDGHTTTIGQLSVKADGLQTKFEQVSDGLTAMGKNLDGLINPSFASNSMYGWTINPTNNVRLSTYDTSVGGPYLVIDSPNPSPKLMTFINDGILTFTPGHTYRIHILTKTTDRNSFVEDEGFTIRLVKPGTTTLLTPYANIRKADYPTGFTTISRDITITKDAASAQLRLAFNAQSSSGSICIKSVAIEDITEAQTALVKTSELQQNLDGFKQTVEETYTTKDEFDNLQIGGRNLLLNTKTSKQVVGNNGTNQGMTLYNLSTYSWAHLDPGEYTISADIFYEGTISGKFAFQRDNKPWGFTPAAGKNFADIPFFTTAGKRKAHVEFCVKNAYDGASKGLAVRFDNVQGTVTFSNVKLEKGTKATTWSPAPEDMLDAATASTTYTTKTEFTQTSSEIRGKVEEQGTTIDGHTNSIANLSLKADKFETDISQTSEQVDGILDRTSTLEQDLGGFKQSVSNTYISKTDAEQNLIDAINGIQIGGSNMLLDTQKFGQANPNNVADAYGRLININAATDTGSTNLENTKYANGFVWRGIPSSNTANNPDGPRYQVTVKPGGVYTFSFEAFTTAGFWVYFYGPNGYIKVKKTICSTGTPLNATNGDGAVQFNATGAKWTHHEITWELDSAGSTNVKYVLFRRVGSTGYTTFMAPKLEEGNKATEWTPSPFDTLYASTITSTYAPKTMVQQTEDRITQTVEAKYATKTQLTDEMKKSVKTIEIRGRMDGNYWWKLGRLTMEQQGRDFHIDYTGGRGYNGMTSQNSQFEIHVRSSNGGGTLFAVTLNRLLNADMYQVKAFAIDATHIDLYIKSGANYSTGTMAYYGQYSDFSGAKQIDDISTAEGTELTVFEQSLSTKTYVDQTANSVAIGVIEEYKNGEHGDKLTTSADITVLKDEINQTVQKNYADMSEKIELKGSENVVQNPSFEVADFAGWETHDNWYYNTTGGHTGQNYAVEPINPNSNGDELINSGSIKVEFGHTYRVSFWAKSDLANGVYAYSRYQRKVNGVWQTSMYSLTTDMIEVGRDWKQITFDIEPEQKASEIRVRIIGRNNASGVAYFAVDDVSLTDYSVAKTINNTIAGINVKADSIQTKVEQVSTSLDVALANSEELLYNGGFEFGMDGWSCSYANLIRTSNDAHSGMKWARTLMNAKELISTKPIKAIKGRRYRFGVWYKIGNGYANNYGGLRLQKSTDGTNFSDWKNQDITMEHTSGGDWRYAYVDGVADDAVRFMRARIAFRNTIDVFLDDLSIKDITDAYDNAEKTDMALKKSSTLEQDLTGFRQTVSETYVTNDTLTKVQSDWKHTTDGFEASIKKTEKDVAAINGSITIVNGSFETRDTTGWTFSNFKNTSISNGSIYQNTTYRFLGYRNGNAMPKMENSGTVAARRDDFIKVSARVLLLNSSNTSISGSMRIGVKNTHSGVPYLGTMTIMDGGWNTVSYNVKATEDGTYSLWLDFPSTIAESTKILVDDVTMANETEAVHADTRIKALETRIAMTAEGVRVGKIENGTFQGTSALMNSEGSFDILQGEETVSSFTKGGVKLMRDSTTNKYQFNIIPFKYETGGSVNMAYQGVNLQSMGIFSLNGVPATPAVDLLSINGSGVTNVKSTTELTWNTAALFNSQTVKHFDGKALHKLYYGNINKGAVPCAPDEVDHCICVTNTSDGAGLPNTSAASYFMILHPAWYMIQMQANLNKPSNVTYIDVRLQILPVGATTWVTAPGTYDFRAIEQGDPQGWHTRPTSTFFCKFDVGTRLRWRVLPNANTTTVGSLAKFTITRLPFSGLDTSAYNY